MGRPSSTTKSVFWEDLNRDLADPEFRAAYESDTRRIRTFDQLINSLDERREAVGWSKADLARVTGRRPSTVRRLFAASKRAKIETYVDLATALGLELEVKVVHNAPKTRGHSAEKKNRSAKAMVHGSRI
jgi:ribosome-binding protein aMBF1 (putative translation factor)